MNKSTKLIIVLFAVAVPAIIVAVALTTGKSDAPSVDHNKHSAQEHEQAVQASTSAQNNGDASKQADAVQVEIKDYAYAPETITIKAGTTVTWTNKDSVRHDVVAKNMSINTPKSDLLAKGESYSFTFNKPGTYEYYCSPHPYMKGKVVVTE